MNRENKFKLLPNTDTHNCFACSPGNSHGLQMKVYYGDGTVYSWVTVPEYMCGWNKTVHGGIISTILDEIMGWAGIYLLKQITITKKITVEFIKTVYVGDQLTAKAIVGNKQGKRETEIMSYLYNNKDELCAKAEGTFTLISTEVARRLNIINNRQIETFLNPLIHS